MKHEFLMVSYQKDFPWLWHALRAVKKNARGYGLTIVVPTGQSDPVKEMLQKLALHGKVHEDTEPAGLGQLFSQVTKCSADVFVSPDCQFVHFLDSDTLVQYPCTPDKFFRDGKPMMRYNSYEHLVQHGCGSVVWKKVVEDNLGFPVGHEFMRNTPMVYPRALFPALRAHVEQVHNKQFASYVFGTGRNAWPQLFCESNDLGAFAWEKMHDIYHWVNLDTDEGRAIPYTPFVQFFSHGGFDRPCDFGNRETPREMIRKLIGWA